jgi:hypothetical protein
MQMRTLFSIIVFLVLGGVIKFVAPHVLMILSFPGRLIILPNEYGKCSQGRFLLGATVTTILFFYVYLAYTALAVDLSLLAIHKQGVGNLVMLGTFFAVFFPLGFCLGEAKKKLTESQQAYRIKVDEASQNTANARERILDMTVRAYASTFFFALIGFFVFAFYPGCMKLIFGWISSLNLLY